LSNRLRELSLLPAYDKTVDDIAADFYVPCLARAIGYDRLSGYFSSSVYILAWEALKEFIRHEGRIRVICSPYMTAKDIEGVELGYAARSESELAHRLKAEFDWLCSQPLLQAPAQVLAWLIAHERMDIRIATVKVTAPASDKRLFHDKVGVFRGADGDAVGFRGSMNETFLGLSSDGNLESVDVFPNWVGGRDEQRVLTAMARFELLWGGAVDGVEITHLPNETRKGLIEASPSTAPDLLIDEIVAASARPRQPLHASQGQVEEKQQSLVLRSYQLAVLESWRRAGYRGIIEHATGSGKTLTALVGMREWLREARPALLLVPTTLLLDQWKTELIDFWGNSVKLLMAGGGHRHWATPGVLRRWLQPRASEIRVVLSTYQTAATDEFTRLLGEPEGLLLVADEVHRMGSAQTRRLFDIAARGRLGLSATPQRYGDAAGTNAILTYFGQILTPRYQLPDAIRDGVLTPYDYEPQVVKLTPAEATEWRTYTKEIRRRYAQLHGSHQDPYQDDRIRHLLMRRASLVKGADNKTELAVNIVRENLARGSKWLVYCDNRDQLARVRTALARNGISSLAYHSAMDADRDATLHEFDLNGGLLVAIRCLDEGVNIPSVSHAVILASSRNPREFIQRRGRVLRRFPEKWLSHIYDALVIADPEEGIADAGERLLWAEMARAIEFGTWANNPQCVTELERICIEHGVDFRNLTSVGEESDTED
jgi:superfamily II DNA or RNA helicase